MRCFLNRPSDTAQPIGLSRPQRSDRAMRYGTETHTIRSRTHLHRTQLRHRSPPGRVWSRRTGWSSRGTAPTIWSIRSESGRS